jgi:protein SCO1/2
MPSRRAALIATLSLAAALLLGAAGWFWYVAPQGPSGTGVALVGGPFELTNQEGKRVTDKDFRGRYMLVFFGYTFCPDVCPTTLQMMTQALDKIGPAANNIQPVFITIDPARDTPDTLKSYVSNFSPRLIGLTGSADDIAGVARAYRVAYSKQETGDPKNYLMDHSSIIYLMGPDGAFVKFFTYTTDVDKLAKDIAAATSSSS